MADNIFDIDIQKAQGLRFVDKANYNKPQHYDYRLLEDLKYANTVKGEYVQKWQQGDSITIHFRTNYIAYAINLINLDTDSTTNITGNQILRYTDSSGRMYYDLPINTSLLNGCYKVIIDCVENYRPILQFISENFKVSSEVEDSLYFEWFGNDRTYDDGMHWTIGTNQGLRIVSRDVDFELSQSKNVDENTNNTPRTTKAKPNKAIIVDINLEPQWILEKINLALQNDEFYVNGVKYNNDEPVSKENLGKLIKYKSKITLIESEYQNGDSIERTGDLPVITDVLRTTGLAIRTTGLNNRKINN